MTTSEAPPLENLATSAATPAPVSLHQTIIEPATAWQLINASELWKNRELLFFLIWRDVKVRYKQTLLGAAWAILQPVMTMVVFTIFFGKLAGLAEDTGGLPYPVFVYAGVLPWTFFATAIASAGNSVVGSERLITKIYFPRLAIPFAAVGAALVDFVLAFLVLIGMMFYYHVAPRVQVVWIPLLVALLTLAALGVGTLLAALNVAYRDFRYVIPFLVQLWMFATPAVYMQVTHQTATASYPAIVRYGLLLNPMTGLIATFRAAMLGRPMPWHQFGFASILVCVMFIFGCLYFRKVEDSFADKI